jgi:hypothetical protein
MGRDQPPLDTLELGGGTTKVTLPGEYTLTIPAKPEGYTDAQVDDYHRLMRKDFYWNPPVLMRMRAKASRPDPTGTLGFGFWNDPFSLSLGQGGAARTLPASPQALWFFCASPPNDLQLEAGIPGHGFKASSLSSPRLPSLLLTPLAAAALVLTYLPPLRGPILRTALGFAQAQERVLDTSLTDWHTYELLWEAQAATFRVDGERVLTADQPPSGPLGFVAWIDNQYAVASPEKGLAFGSIPTRQPQSLRLRLEHLGLPV